MKTVKHNDRTRGRPVQRSRLPKSGTRFQGICVGLLYILFATSTTLAQPPLPVQAREVRPPSLSGEFMPVCSGVGGTLNDPGPVIDEWHINHWRNPGPDPEHPGLAIEVIDLPGYGRGQLYLNGNPLPSGYSDDIAFVTYLRDTEKAVASPDTGNAPGTRDQGRILGADGTITLTAETVAQSVTVGRAGQLGAIQMRWNGDFPDPVPYVNLAILAGGDPSTWETLYMTQLAVSDLPVDEWRVFTWDLSEAHLSFEQGEQFTFTLSLESGFTEAEVVSVVDMGVIENDPGVRFRDAGYSARFQGSSIWLFGDTFLESPNAEGEQMLCNSWSATFDLDVVDGLHGFQPPVDCVGAAAVSIPNTDAESKFNLRHRGENCLEEPCGARWAIWPGTIAVDEERDIAYLFYHKIYAEPGHLTFTPVGHSVAVWESLDRPVVRPEFCLHEEYPTLLFSGKRDGYGSAAVHVDTELYVYGCELQPGDVLKPCSLARVPIGQVLEPAAWEYYHGGDRWSGRLDGATTVFHGNNMMSVFYDDYLERYVAVYSQPFSAQVVLRTARRPEGPWSRPLQLFTGEQSTGFMGWIYDALAHPELSTDGGRTIYITYSRQTGLMRSEFRLVAVEVALMQ